MVTDREILDIVVFGASGYTGRLVCEHLQQRYGSSGVLSWGMAGRSAEALAAARDAMRIDEAIPLLIADAQDAAALDEVAARARVVIACAGPFQRYGHELVRACAQAGTDYLDLCGEFHFIQQQIRLHSEVARQSGARIICSAGFDSTPFDAGVYFLQQRATALFGRPCTRVRCRVRSADIPVSGGTIQTYKAFLAATAEDPAVGSDLANPFALTPGFVGAPQPLAAEPEYDDELESWSAPFWMAMINTKNVHRSNFLLDFPYGKDFEYEEMVLTGPGVVGKARAEAVAADTSILELELQPGDGPSREEREAGSYDLLFVGTQADGRSIRVAVKGDMDAGYGSTAKIIAESAVLLLERSEVAPAGVLTPIAALGADLVARLEQRAGISFELE